MRSKRAAAGQSAFAASKKIPQGEVSILSVSEATKVLTAASAEEVAFVALALFSGVRVAEFRKSVRISHGEERDTWLDRKDVNLRERQLFVPPELDRNHRGRYVDIAANAVSGSIP